MPNTAQILIAEWQFVDDNIHPLLRKWSDPPRPIEILETMDYFEKIDLKNPLAVRAVQLEYEIAMRRTGTYHEEVVADATWRKKDGNA